LNVPAILDPLQLRQDSTGEAEFVTVNFFEALEALKAAAGAEYEARRLPAKIKPVARHYEVKQPAQS
jgi:hypothetical protein